MSLLSSGLPPLNEADCSLSLFGLEIIQPD